MTVPPKIRSLVNVAEEVQHSPHSDSAPLLYWGDYHAAMAAFLGLLLGSRLFPWSCLEVKDGIDYIRGEEL